MTTKCGFSDLNKRMKSQRVFFVYFNNENQYLKKNKQQTSRSIQSSSLEPDENISKESESDSQGDQHDYVKSEIVLKFIKNLKNQIPSKILKNNLTASCE